MLALSMLAQRARERSVAAVLMCRTTGVERTQIARRDDSRSPGTPRHLARHATLRDYFVTPARNLATVIVTE
jgi:hypothetical protein